MLVNWPGLCLRRGQTRWLSASAALVKAYATNSGVDSFSRNFSCSDLLKGIPVFNLNATYYCSNSLQMLMDATETGWTLLFVCVLGG